MNTRKIVSYGIFAVLMVLAFAALSLTGCGNGTEPDPDHAHEWGRWDVEIAATCEGTGKGTRACTICGVKDSNTIIPASGHDWERTVTTEPTETADGEESVVCKNDPSHAETRAAYATGTAGLAFELIDDNTAYRVRKGTVTTGAVHIPAYRLYEVNNYYLPITEIGSASDYSNEGAFQSASNIIAVTIPAGVTSIGSYAFWQCNSLTGITIPASVTSIGSYAFWQCNSLTGITIPASVTSIGSYAFSGCTGLTAVTFAAGSQLQSISNRTFSGCTSLTSIDIPASVTHFGELAFSGCTGLTSITIPAGVTSIIPPGNTYFSFNGCTGLTSVTVDGNNHHYASEGGVLYNKAKTTLLWAPQGITSVTIPASVTTVSPYAFRDCVSLTGSITIPASVTEIGVTAFRGCTGLTSITVGSANLHYASEGGVLYNKAKTTLIKAPEGITSVTIPAGVTSIGLSAFFRCASLTEITIPAGVTEIGYQTFSDCTGLTGIDLPNSVTSIGSYAFSGCTGLTSITIPDSLTSISDSAFYECIGLTSITLPTSLTTIGSYAFYYCTSLTEITIPASVTSIGNSAFYGWNALKKINIQGKNDQAEADAAWGVDWRRECSAVIEYGYGQHNWGTWTVATPPAESTNGEETRTCPHDGSPHSETRVAYATGTPGLAFELNGSTYDVSKGTVESGVVYIPGYYRPNAESPYLRVRVYGDAFNNTSITAVHLLEGLVMTIGDRAFNGCTSLTSITVDANNAAYASEGGVLYNKAKTTLIRVPEGITSITIPASVTSINESAFQRCASLTSINIPAGVTSIGNSAFYGCAGLTSINIPAGVTSIGNSAFSGCTSLTSINIPASVTSIGNSAFYGCASLTSITVDANNPNYASQDGILYNKAKTTMIHIPQGISGAVTIPAGVTSIGSGAFSGCTSLTSINIPAGVTSIGQAAFQNCASLTSIIIPNSVTSIGEGAFRSCVSLTSINIPAGVTFIGGTAFYNCASLTSINIPAGVTSIGNWAFYDCASLETVTFAANSQLETIGRYAFSGCTSLASITIPEGVTYIGELAFRSCVSLTSINVPAGVTSIGRAAFDYWTSSQTIYIAGYASQAAADAAWDNWRNGCSAIIKYWNGSEYQ